MTAQEHINQVQERWTSSDPNVVATTANTIEDIINSIFADSARIGYELLQNADDAGSSSNNVEVKYYLLDKHLVIQHNGSHFDFDNIEALCQYGSSSKAKEGSDKIGYKGIGFKSVFNIADKVWILSKDYTFRFDKSYWGDQPMPWQIVPIYTEGSEIPTEISAFLNSEKVTFFLELKEKFWETKKHGDLMNSIAKALGNEQNLLFLRHVINFEILYKHPKSGEISSFRKLAKTKDKHIVSLQKFAEKMQEGSFSRWHVSTFPITIPKAISETLFKLNNTECPEKLKYVESIEMSFAAKVGENNSIQTFREKERIPIFSYLPTNTSREFPFIVNSNFLLNEARTKLLDVEWNDYLFKQIGYFQFNWFKEMAEDERFKFEFAGLIKKYDSNSDRFNKSLNQGVTEAQSEIAFVPVLNSEELKIAPDTIIDKTGISYEIQEHELVKEEFLGKTYEIADPKIKNIDKLVKIGANEFNHQKLSAAIKKGNRFKNPVDNTKLIDYFYNHIKAISTPSDKLDWMNVLNETPFLLDNNNVLQEPPTLYFPRDKPELPFELPMNFLNETIYSDRIKDDKKLEDWLGELKVAFPKPLEIIRNGLSPLIGEKEINHKNAILITKYLFEHRDKLEPSDFEKLKHLPLLTKGHSLREAMFCYLSDEYEPNLLLEQYINDDIFVSVQYANNPTELEAWKYFWMKLGARQDMVLELHENEDGKGYNFNEMSTHPIYKDYAFFLKPLPPHNESGIRKISSLLIPRYIQYANSYSFSLEYWGLLLNNRWNELILKSDKTKFKHSSGTALIPSYFAFLVQTNPYFPATDGICHKTTEVYSQSLQNIIIDWKPISYFELTSSQEKLLGIQSALSLDDCMAILELIVKIPDEIDKQRITALYKYMLNHFDEEVIKKALESAVDFQLLAINNSFQSIANLQYFNLPKFVGKADSSDFIFLDLDKNDALNFCKLFGIEEINEGDLELEPNANIETNQSFITEWNIKLPYIVVISSSIIGSSYESELSRLREKTNETKFKASDKLSLVLNKSGESIPYKEVSAWQQNNDVYSTHNWHDKRVIFEFTEVLCHYFDIKETERELELILTLEKNDVYNWLGKQGFDVSVIQKEQESVQTELDISEGFKTINEPPIFIGTAYGEGEITTSKPQPNTNLPIDEGVNKGFGYWGEKHVQKKNIIEKHYEENNIEIVSVNWLNEIESGNPYDFEVETIDGLKHYWEVKSTPSATKAEFPISSNEIQFALKNSEVYFIVRVFNAGNEEAQTEPKIWSNPIELIKNGRIKISDVKMEIIDSELVE